MTETDQEPTLLTEHKKQLRNQLKHEREQAYSAYMDQGHSPTSHATFLQGLKIFLEKQNINACLSIAVYKNFGSEAPTQELIHFLWEQGHAVSLPKIIEGDMYFFPYEKGDTLTQNTFGFMEPAGFMEHVRGNTDQKYSATEPLQREIYPKVYIAPLLGFDSKGTRIGYGKGYYDRFFARIWSISPPKSIIGLAFDAQEMPDLPNEPHDIPLEGIITPGKYRIFGHSRV